MNTKTGIRLILSASSFAMGTAGMFVISHDLYAGCAVIAIAFTLYMLRKSAK